MDLLEYKKEDLNKLSTEELKKLLDECKTQENKYHAMEMTKKILINSLYGALANKGFSLFNELIAQSITGNGRFFIQLGAKNIENKLQEILKSDKPYVTYGDTDSCVYDTEIQTDKGLMKIGDLYYNSDGKEIEYKPGKFIKELKNSKALSYNIENKQIELNSIIYVMKHKVKKRFYKIKCGNDEVVITGDHSVMVKRDEQVIEVKPSEIKKTDKLIYNLNFKRVVYGF